MTDAPPPHEAGPVLSTTECPECGHRNHAEAKYCSRCGAVVVDLSASAATRSTRANRATGAVGDRSAVHGDESRDRTDLRPPGWYPDPFRRHRARWWDGSSWSWYAADDEVLWDPTPAAEVRP
ncbi:MAG TPA: DUF2510 domain-containing protein, partial [Acidimicrobiales bacterium]|nr:DUF2510 domain-containing protein [Acidimicrobiales bacterium]